VILPRFGEADGTLPAGVEQERAVAGRLAWSARAVALARSRRPGLVICGHFNAAPLGALVSAAARAPLWLQLHGCEAWSRRPAAWRRAIKRARLITAVSRHTRRRFDEWADVGPDLVRVLPNTVSDQPRPPPDPGALAARLALADRKVIVTVGRLAASERYKGHDRIIACLPTVRAANPEAVYLVVGDGDDAPRLRALAAQSGVAEHVVFAGQVGAEDLHACLALATVFAMPSTGEGFGIAFLEAAAAGLPVIGGDRDGSVDALADGALGRLIDPLDGSALATALIDGLSGGIAPAPEGARRFCVRNFTAHVDALLEQLLSDSASRAPVSTPIVPRPGASPVTAGLVGFSGLGCEAS
jgi:phosphatidylinositol alpha-1,6-mannosyltransferase